MSVVQKKRRPSWMDVAKSYVLVCLITLCALLVSLEIFLRIQPVTFAPVLVSSEFGRIGNSLHPQIDQQGFRNERVPDDTCLAFLGDSQVFGNGVAMDKTFVARLGALARIAAYNMGVPGTSILNQLLLLPKAIQLRPSMVYLSFYGGNDLADLSIEVKEGGTLADQVIEQFGLHHARNNLSQTPLKKEWIERDRITHEMVDRYLRHLGDNGQSWRRRAFIAAVRNLKSVEFLDSIWTDLLGTSHEFREPKQFAFDVDEPYGIVPGTDTLFLNDGPFVDIFQNELRGIALDLDRDEIDWALAMTESLLERAKTVLSSSSIPFSVLLIPTKETAFAAYLSARGIDLPASYRRMVANENTVLDELIAFMKARNISYIDLRPTLSHLVEAGVQTHLFFDGHLSVKGHQGVAEALLDALPPDKCKAGKMAGIARIIN